MKKTLIAVLCFLAGAVSAYVVPYSEVTLEVNTSVANTASAYGGSQTKTINDPFAYHPDSPTSPKADTWFGGSKPGFHAFVSEGTIVTLAYSLSEGPLTLAGSDSFILDFYGRSGNYKDRDDDFKISLYSRTDFVTEIDH
ncbi:MAG: hypothetical protein HRT88_23920, partial [Lentisphaeraceae bacterium]|nr:hypothetical protein [Lentisphaeraceae bacterium]